MFVGLIIPVCLAIIGGFINERIENIDEVVQLAIVVFGFYIMLYSFLKLIQDYIYKNVKEMNEMVGDLQDVLDRCFYIEDGDILK